MPALATVELNRANTTQVTPADQAAGLGYIALNLDLTGGRIVLIDGIEFMARVNVAADLALLTVIQVAGVKEVNLNAGLPVGVQLPSGFVDMFNLTGNVFGERVISRQFTQPLRLENMNRFVIFGQTSFSGAPANTYALTMGIYGRVARAGEAPFPYQLR